MTDGTVEQVVIRHQRDREKIILLCDFEVGKVWWCGDHSRIWCWEIVDAEQPKHRMMMMSNPMEGWPSQLVRERKPSTSRAILRSQET